MPDQIEFVGRAERERCPFSPIELKLEEVLVLLHCLHCVII
jgi:hypothetical protein